VTNIGQDALLTLHYATSVFDNLGGKYTLAGACIGNICEGRGFSYISREMISDVPVNIRLVFSGLPQGATQIAKLIVAVNRGSHSGGRTLVSFRNIALSPK
jgi:hypothetical protein